MQAGWMIRSNRPPKKLPTCYPKAAGEQNRGFGIIAKPPILLMIFWCRGTESNCRHADFQSTALPTELPRRNVCLQAFREFSGVMLSQKVGSSPIVGSDTSEKTEVSRGFLGPKGED